MQLKQGTNNKILDHVSIYAAQINTCWMQTLSRLLKTNGFAYVLFDTQNFNRDQPSKQFLQRYKYNYLKSLYYSDSNRIDNYLALKENSDNYQFQTYLEKIKTVEHLTRLRTGCTYLAVNTGRYEKTPKNDRRCPLCKQGIEDSSHFLFQCLKKTNIRARQFGTNNTFSEDHVISAKGLS